MALDQVSLCRVGSVCVKSGQITSGRIGSGQNGSDKVESCQIRLGCFRVKWIRLFQFDCNYD